MTLFLSISSLWRPLVVLWLSTTLKFWIPHCCHLWPLRPGPAPLMSSPQPPQPFLRTCQRSLLRPCSFSVDLCPVWRLYLFLHSRQTVWPLLPLLCTYWPHHAQSTTTGTSKDNVDEVKSKMQVKCQHLFNQIWRHLCETGVLFFLLISFSTYLCHSCLN